MSKLGIWTTIVGAGLVASLATSVTFFKEHTALITGISTLVSAIVALLVTLSKKEEPNEP
jgi:hypothetical protein